MLTLKIDGVTDQTKTLILGKGQRQEVLFATAYVGREPSRLPGRLSGVWWIIPTGEHLVDVNGVQGKLTSQLWINWLFILIILIIIALVVWWLLRGRRRRQPRPSAGADDTTIA